MSIALVNCTCITMDPDQPAASAVAIEGERISFVGEKLPIGTYEQVIDLKGAYLYPGFIDTHAHIFYTGYMQAKELRLSRTASKDEVLETVAAKIKTALPGVWIVGSGWDEHSWVKNQLPVKEELDEVSPNNPVFLRRADSHAAWVNSLALSLAGIDRETFEPQGGKIHRDPHGYPTGMLVDAGMKLVYPLLPRHDEDDIGHFIVETLQEALSLGITTIHDAALSPDQIAACIELAKEKKLPLRIYGMVYGSVAFEPKEYSPFFELRCLKLFMDGTMGSRGAALFEPYEDAPSEQGFLRLKDDELLEMLQKAKASGFQVACHAIGDRATHEVLNAYEKVGVKGCRWRIEHAQQLIRADINRFSELGVIAAMQPLHMPVDMPWLTARLGEKRVREGAFVWRSLLDAGAIVCGGSDAPVVDLNPLLGIHAAITHGVESVTAYEAVRMYTVDAAYSCFKEKEVGAIKQGMLADLVVLPENILTCNPNALLDMQVLYTLVNGKVCYEKP